MALDVEIPDPPSLSGPQSRGTYEAIDMTDVEPSDDYRRETIATMLAEGAWAAAFEEWADHTYLSEAEFDVVATLELFEDYDFYWDPAADEVGFRAPSLPATLPAPFDERFDQGDREGIAEELDALGRVVTERLESDYLLRDEEDFGFFADDDTGSADGGDGSPDDG